MNDKQLRRKVIDQLELDPDIDAAHIGVAVAGGVVTLTGYAPTCAQRLAAEQTTKAVEGVIAVAEEIEVRPPGHPMPDDEDLARNAAVAVAYDANLPEQGIMIEVSDGCVTLTGEVDRDSQRQAAADDVRQIHGVRVVDNRLTLKQGPLIAELKATVRKALAPDA